MRKAFIAILIIAVVGLIAVHFTRNTILQGASVGTAASPSVEQQVTKNVTSSAANATTPVFSSDVQVLQIQYFDNKTWLVATVNQRSAPGNIAYIIMKLEGSTYQTVAGPGTDFGGNLLPNDVPADVQDYINTQTGN
jgi:hypothetical protein